MTRTLERRLVADGTYNVRDLGGYAAVDGETRWGRVLRADGLHRITPEGIEVLLRAGLRTVIDLRHYGEIDHSPNPFAKHHDVAYLHVSLFDGLSPRPSADNANVGDSVLLDLYIQALSTRGEAIRTVLEAIANANGGAVLFHCTAGKDRTGIIAGLLLAVAQVSLELILDDYTLTGDLIAPLILELVADAEMRGADVVAFRKLLGSDPKTMSAMFDYIDETFGNVGSYLNSIGVEDATVARLRSRLLHEEELVASVEHK